MDNALALTIGCLVMAGCLVIVAWLMLPGLLGILSRRISDEIDCPECEGGKRRGPGPCPTCGPNLTVKRGGNSGRHSGAQYTQGGIVPSTNKGQEPKRYVTDGNGNRHRWRSTL